MRRIAGIVLVFIIMVGTGCVSKPGEDATMRIGYLASQAQPEVYALYNGYYEEEGLNISWVSFRGGSSVIEAIMAGELDGGTIGSSPAIIRVVSKDVPLKVVAVGELGTKEKPGDYLVVRKNSGIKSVSDLKGKTIAIHRMGTTLDLTLRIALEQNGIDPAKDVTITQLSAPSMPQALLQGDVDAAFIFPMSYPQLEADVDVILTPGDVFPHGAPFGMAVFTEDFIEKHPEEVRKFVRAYLRGLQWALDNPDMAAEVEALDTGMTKEEAKRVPWAAFNPSGRVSDESFEMMIDAIKEYDPESLGRDVTVGEFVDYSYLPPEA
ncbi:ABC transporter substrate-binding protein [archaeon]|nr:ABC transporter substrate-binding protein [archaeon]